MFILKPTLNCLFDDVPGFWEDWIKVCWLDKSGAVDAIEAFDAWPTLERPPVAGGCLDGSSSVTTEEEAVVPVVTDSRGWFPLVAAAAVEDGCVVGVVDDPDDDGPETAADGAETNDWESAEGSWTIRFDAEMGACRRRPDGAVMDVVVGSSKLLTSDSSSSVFRSSC